MFTLFQPMNTPIQTLTNLRLRPHESGYAETTFDICVNTILLWCILFKITRPHEHAYAIHICSSLAITHAQMKQAM